jgi:hypothetical protein
MPELLKDLSDEEKETVLKFMLSENAPTFNWADKYQAALLESKKSAEKPLPDVKIVSVTSTGVVRLKFSQPMIIPPLDLIRNAAALDSSVDKGPSITNNNKISGRLLQTGETPALLVSIKPGKYSKELNFSMSYNITSYHHNTLELTLSFDNPLQVSSMADPDQVEIKFVGSYYFFNYLGKTISANTTIKATLPK